MLMVCYVHNFQIDFIFAIAHLWQIEQRVFMLDPLFVFSILDKNNMNGWMNMNSRLPNAHITNVDVAVDYIVQKLNNVITR